MGLCGLKNKFMQKAKEMHTYLSGGNLYKFDSGTLQSELDKDRLRRQKIAQVQKLKKAKGKFEEKSQDYLIKMNSDTPLDFIRPLQDKFCIKYDEMTSKPKFKDLLSD